MYTDYATTLLQISSDVTLARIRHGIQMSAPMYAPMITRLCAYHSTGMIVAKATDFRPIAAEKPCYYAPMANGAATKTETLETAANGMILHM